MLISIDAKTGQPVEASAELRGFSFRCPACDGQLILKCGAKKIAHFAHLQKGSCWAEESTEKDLETHLKCQKILARKFVEMGYTAKLEEVHRDARRRIDIAVTVQGTKGPIRFAIEVQNSPISVEKMKSRNAIDRQLGFAGTLWIFTSKRWHATKRVPTEMRWISNRYWRGITVFNPDTETVEIHEPRGGGPVQSTFWLVQVCGRYPNEQALMLRAVQPIKCHCGKHTSPPRLPSVEVRRTHSHQAMWSSLFR